MAILNAEFYRADEDALYSDGDIEQEIYDRVCQKDPTIYDDQRWEVFYHFSPLRENILNWYPFKPGCRILEIGAGCGALTGLLVRRSANVVSCELTMQRAKILYERHRDAEDLEVVVGDFMRMRFAHKFDYIVVNGVLEYAKSIIGEDKGNPFVHFLAYVKSLLEDDGKILLAIENRFGLKYFNGAPEDHTGVIFDGTNGYPRQSGVQTFNKNELKNLFNSVQLNVFKWYYPYPDYKFPTEIFTDDSIQKMFPITAEFPFDQDRVELFDKKAVYAGLMADGIVDHFSNSFLVEVGVTDQLRDVQPTYVKISNNRKKDFALCTLLYESVGKVEKRALYPSGFSHLAHMNESCLGDETILKSSYEAGVLTTPLLKRYETLQERLSRMVKFDNQNAFWAELENLKKRFTTEQVTNHISNNEFVEVFGDAVVTSRMHWKKHVNIDLNAENLFFDGAKMIVIDNEWIFAFPIPVEYTFWRLLMQLRDQGIAEEWLTGMAIRHFLQIEQQDIDVFQQWERHFARDYVGIKDLSPMQKTVLAVSLHDVVVEKMRQNTLKSQLFLFDNDMEYSAIQGKVFNDNGIWVVRYTSERIAQAKSIRWDPLEGDASRIYDIKVDGLDMTPINAYSADSGSYIFTTYDPQFAVSGDWSKLHEIVIRFKCEILDWTQGYYIVERERNEERAKRVEEERQWSEKQNSLEFELRRTSDELAKTSDELAKTSDELAKTSDELVKTSDELVKTSDELVRTSDELEIEKEKLGRTKDELNKVTSALDWLENEIKEHPWKSIAKILLKKRI